MNKIWNIILKAPLILVVIISFIASIYTSYKGTYNMTFGTPIILGAILFLYFLGVYFGRNKAKEEIKNPEEEAK